MQLILGLALSSELLYFILSTVTDLAASIPLFLLCFGSLFSIYWFAAMVFFDFGKPAQSKLKTANTGQTDQTQWRHWLHKFIEKQKNQEKLTTKEVMIIGVVFSVIFRLTLLFSTPSLSQDIYRYVWDGKVASEGINPYQHPPDAQELNSLRDDEIHPKVNHKEIPTIYPPAAQIVFWAIHEISPATHSFKLAFLVFDLLTMAIIFFILKSFSINPNRLLLYAWNPLVIIEFSGSGHMDIVGIFFLILALWLLIKNRWHGSTFMLALSFLTKFVAIIFLPIVMFFKKENKLIILLLFLILTGLFYLPYADAGQKLFAGLLTYTEKWQYNSPVFSPILAGVKELLPESLVTDLMITPYGLSEDAETLATRKADLALHISKIIIAVTFSAIFIYFFVRLKRDIKRAGDVWIFRLGLTLLGAFILLNPTVHPWYICWVLPLAVIVGNRAWILLSGLVALSYWTLIDYTSLGIWQQSPWVLWIEYLPFFILLIYDSLWPKFKDAKLGSQNLKSIPE